MKCVCLCLSAAAGMKPSGFQLHPSEPKSIFYRGLQLVNPPEAGGFTSARKCQIRGQIRGKIRG